MLTFYIQGPCKNGELLILPPKQVSPKCIKTKCSGKEVPFLGKCVKLNENAGCPKGHLVVQIDSSTLQLNCTINFGSRFGDDEALDYTTVPVDDKGSYCLLAGKRSQEEKCITIAA